MTTHEPKERIDARSHSVETGARIGNLLLGTWLVLSAFLWPHTPASFANSWITGVIIAITASWAMARPRMRWVNAACAVWLLVSSLALYPASAETMWNNSIVACFVFVLALMPTRGRIGPGR